eukprot:PhF_6_TR1026/c2_g1_i3/m.2079
MIAISLLISFFCVHFLHYVSPTDAKENLPPHAYLNRTMYPPLYTYDETPHLSIGLISDVQYADQEEFKRRHFRMSPMKLRSAVADMNVNRSLDFVVHLGDLVDHEMHTNIGPVMAILKDLKAPLFHVLGNHDFEKEDIDKVPSMLGLKSRYYTFVMKNYRFIVLDGNDLSLYATHAGSAKYQAAQRYLEALARRKAKNAQRFNGAIDKDQMSWLQTELGDACRVGQRVIILVHHPMRPKDEPTNLWNDLDVVRVVVSYPCVVAVVNGHAHKFLYDYHHAVHGDVHFITMGGMVQSPFTSYGYLDVFDDILHLHGLIFGRAITYMYNISRKAPAQPPKEVVATTMPQRPILTYPPHVVTSISSSTSSSSSAAVVVITNPGGGKQVSIAVISVTMLLVAIYLYRSKRRKQSGAPLT